MGLTTNQAMAATGLTTLAVLTTAGIGIKLAHDRAARDEAAAEAAAKEAADRAGARPIDAVVHAEFDQFDRNADGRWTDSEATKRTFKQSTTGMKYWVGTEPDGRDRFERPSYDVYSVLSMRRAFDAAHGSDMEASINELTSLARTFDVNHDSMLDNGEQRAFRDSYATKPEQDLWFHKGKPQVLYKEHFDVTVDGKEMRVTRMTTE